MENRSFQDRWEADYLFVNVKDRPVCLVCGANMAVRKEYNIRRHYEAKHQDKYKNLDMKQKLQKVEEMKIHQDKYKDMKQKLQKVEEMEIHQDKYRTWT